MQNRRLLDRHFAEAGAVSAVVAESHTLIGVPSHIASGGWCGIVPEAKRCSTSSTDCAACAACRASRTRSRAGTVWINTYGHTDTRLPWGGCGGDSGIGRDLGSAAIENYNGNRTMPNAFVSRARFRVFLGAVLTLFAVAGGPSYAQDERVTVFAAASLKDALDDLVRQYKGKRIAVSYAASSTLARQIENGAPADLFISADLDWMAYVDQRQLVKPGTRVNLLRNELVLVAPASNAVKVDIKPGFPLAQLLGDRRLAMADPDSVPAGKYGKAALEALGVWPSVVGRLARAENVRAALLFVSRGEAPLGIVYRTDAAAEGRVRIAGVFPASTHPQIVYPMALLAAGKTAGARGFYDFLKSRAAADVFRRYGFVPY